MASDPPVKQVFECEDCLARLDDNQEPVTIYECEQCSTRFTEEGSADGCSNRCPGCNKFASKFSDNGCPNCGEGELQKITASIPVPAPTSPRVSPPSHAPLVATQDTAPRSWFKAIRSDDADELTRANPLALVLAHAIAKRTWRGEGFNAAGCKLGEALVGDYRALGMSRQKHRTALAQLVKWKFVTTHTTNRGTYATLIDTRLFDPLNITGNHPNSHRPTTKQPPPNHQATTNENEKKEKKDKNHDSLRGLAVKNPVLIELMENCHEVLGPKEMKFQHTRWLRRAQTEPDKLRRVLADTRLKAREDHLDNPAAWAETQWKHFK